MKKKWLLMSVVVLSLLTILLSGAGCAKEVSTKSTNLVINGESYGVTYEILSKTRQGMISEPTNIYKIEFKDSPYKIEILDVGKDGKAEYVAIYGQNILVGANTKGGFLQLQVLTEDDITKFPGLPLEIVEQAVSMKNEEFHFKRALGPNSHTTMSVNFPAAVSLLEEAESIIQQLTNAK